MLAADPIDDAPPAAHRRAPPPEELARRDCRDGIDSCIRTIAKAAPGHELQVVRVQAEEAYRLAALADLDLTELGGRLWGAGEALARLDLELGTGWQDALTATLAEARAAALAPPGADVAAAAAGADPPGAAPPERTLIVRRAGEVAPERIEWLWPGRIAVGKLTLIGGTPGLGKSQLTAFLAATVSTGGAWPCETAQAPRGSVILLSAEDGLADTIIPRLVAAGADLDRVHIVTGVQDRKAGRRGFDLKADIAQLEALAKKLGDVWLIEIDPISAYLGTLDGNDVVRTRNVLEPVAEMADRLRIAVVAVTHLNKGGGGQSVLNRFIGTIAFVAAARAAFAVIEDADDKTRRFFLAVKNNLAKPAQGLAFRIEQLLLEGTDILASRVSFDAEPVEITANEALAAVEELGHGGGDARGGNDEAAELLRAVLAGGPVPVKEIERQAVEAGLLPEGKAIGDNKLFRTARKMLAVRTRREGGAAAAGQWVWELPEATSG